MKRICLVLLGLLLAGCGVQPSGVSDAGQAPTGVTPGETLYFIDGQGRLTPDMRLTRHLGTISEALTLLLEGPSGSDLRTGINDVGPTLVDVTTSPGLIQLRVPLSFGDVTALGVDQIVCTALGVYVQGGGPRNTLVQVEFTLATPESDKRRSCPLIPAG